MSKMGGRKRRKRSASAIEGAASAIEGASNASGSNKSQWEIHSPVSFTYYSSNHNKITHNIEGLINKYREEVLIWDQKQSQNRIAFNIKDQKTIEFLADGVKVAISLLFSKRSLSAIFRLFIDDCDTIEQDQVDKDEMIASDLYRAYEFLSKKLENIYKDVHFEYTNDLLTKNGFAFTYFGYNDNNTMKFARVYLHEVVYGMDLNVNFQERAIQFAGVNIAHEMIHVITSSEYVRKSDEMSPNKRKFKVKVKCLHNRLKSEPGFAWELQVFGAYCFATYVTTNEEQQTFEIKDIALDFYGTGLDVVASANELWFEEIKKGCQANTFISAAAHAQKHNSFTFYNEEKIKQFNNCRMRHCLSENKNICIRT